MKKNAMPTFRRSRKSTKTKRKAEEGKETSKNEASLHPYPRSISSEKDDAERLSGTITGPANGVDNLGLMQQSCPSRVSDVSTAGHQHHYLSISPAAIAALDERASVLEYSDTSDDIHRGDDRYFSLPYSETSPSLLDRNASGSSAFRTLRHSTREEAHKVVHYSSNSVDDFPFDDKSDGSPEEAPLLPTTSMSESPLDGSAIDPRNKNWVVNLAYAFRTPMDENRKMPELTKGKMREHRTQSSASTMEFPPAFEFGKRDQQVYGKNHPETEPLLSSDENRNGLYGIQESGIPPPPPPSDKMSGIDDRKNSKSKRIKSRKMAATIAACYLMDYEAGRPPSLSSNFPTITQEQLRVYRVQFSTAWRWLGVNLAVIFLFMAHAVNDISSVVMHAYAVTILFVEVWMKEVLYGQDHSRDFGHRDRSLVRPMVLFLFALGMESWARLGVRSDYGSDTAVANSHGPFILVTAIFKPLVLFYTSRKARNALEALQRIGRIVVRVLIIEGFLILSFAAVACRMYRAYSGFETLSASWLSLFECKFRLPSFSPHMLSPIIYNHSFCMLKYRQRLSIQACGCQCMRIPNAMPFSLYSSL